MPVARPPLYWMAADPADNLRAAPFFDGLIAVARPDPAVSEALARVSAARALPLPSARDHFRCALTEADAPRAALVGNTDPHEPRLRLVPAH